MARTHYQKLASRDVAVKVCHCVDKLKDEAVLETLSQSFSSQETTSKMPRHQLRRNRSMCSQRTMILRSMSENELSFTQPNFSEGPQSQRVTPIRKRREPFSLKEDDYLKGGIVKHGYGRWTAILQFCSPLFTYVPHCSTMFTVVHQFPNFLLFN